MVTSASPFTRGKKASDGPRDCGFLLPGTTGQPRPSLAP